MRRALCLGAAPALQRTLLIERLERGEVNRAQQVVESVGGKALNAARALATLGTPAAVAGFNGGVTGRQVVALLKVYGVKHDSLTPIRGVTRICTTLIERAGGGVTELVEPGPAPGAGAVARFRRENLKLVAQSSFLALCGMVPAYLAEEFYAPFARAAAQAGVPVVVDSHSAPLTHVLRERPLLAKLNLLELEKTVGADLRHEPEILSAMGALQAMGAVNVFVTRGAEAAYLLTRQGATWRFTPPDIKSRLNTTGSGDSGTAGVVHALLGGRSLREAVRCALACGSANAETLTPGELSRERVRVLWRATKAVRIGSLKSL